MESELEVETGLSERPALEPNDTTAITSQQQDELDRHKVGLPLVTQSVVSRKPERVSGCLRD